MTDVEPRTELATIERAMGDRHGEYFTGPRIDGETVMARRYRSLIEADVTLASKQHEIAEPPPANTAQAPEAYWATPTGQDILREWAGHDGIERNHEAARILISEALSVVPEETRAELQSQIDGLPDGVQAAMVAELASPYVRVEVATPAQVTRFSGTQEGAELVRDWEQTAPRRVGIARARVQRLMDRLSADEAASFAYFADHIASAEFKALANYLSR